MPQTQGIKTFPCVSGDGGDGLFPEIPPGSRSREAGGRLGEVGASTRSMVNLQAQQPRGGCVVGTSTSQHFDIMKQGLS